MFESQLYRLYSTILLIDCVHVRACERVCMHLCVSVRVCVCVRARVPVCVRLRVCVPPASRLG